MFDLTTALIVADPAGAARLCLDPDGNRANAWVALASRVGTDHAAGLVLANGGTLGDLRNLARHLNHRAGGALDAPEFDHYATLADELTELVG